MQRALLRKVGFFCGYVGLFCRYIGLFWHLSRTRSIPQHTATYCIELRYTTSDCIRLQHAATHCNTLQHELQHTPEFMDNWLMATGSNLPFLDRSCSLVVSVCVSFLLVPISCSILIPTIVYVHVCVYVYMYLYVYIFICRYTNICIPSPPLSLSLALSLSLFLSHSLYLVVSICMSSFSCRLAAHFCGLHLCMYILAGEYIYLYIYI